MKSTKTSCNGIGLEVQYFPSDELSIFLFLYGIFENMAIDWTKIYKKYKGLWVAFEDDEKTIVGSGKTAKEAMKKAQQAGYKEPILAHMPEKLVAYIGSDS